MLCQWKERRIEEDESFDPGDDDAFVFARPDGAPLHPHLLSDAFKKLVKRSGLPRIRLHDLRHTHATLLLKSGAPIKVVSERLGHSTPGFTMASTSTCFRECRLKQHARSQPCSSLYRPYRLLPGRSPGRRTTGTQTAWPSNALTRTDWWRGPATRLNYYRRQSSCGSVAHAGTTEVA